MSSKTVLFFFFFTVKPDCVCFVQFRLFGFHDELNGHVFDLERDGLRQVVLCP